LASQARLVSRRVAGLTLRSLSVLLVAMVEWGELSFKVIRLETAGQEVLARAGNFMVARAAFDTSISLWPVAEIELRQGARVILKSKDDRRSNSPAMGQGDQNHEGEAKWPRSSVAHISSRSSTWRLTPLSRVL
jgi:hypothetical protein